MRRWGACIGRRMVGGGLVFLSGDLGAGKTTLAGGILAGYGVAGRVKSPTYTLVESYETPHGPAYHFDLYRLAEPDELDMIGFRDYLNRQALILIEWPEKGGDALPPPDLHLHLHAHAEAHCVDVRHAGAPGWDWIETC